jgi:cell division protein FtsI (penicillin-binding protein 3)
MKLARPDLVGLLVALGITLSMLALLGRVVQLQVAPSAELRSQMQARTTRVQEMGVRGDLLDRRGRTLSTTRVGYRVVADPSLIKPEQLDDVIVKLWRATGGSEDEIGSKLAAAIGRNLEVQRRIEAEKAAAHLPSLLGPSVEPLEPRSASEAQATTTSGTPGANNATPTDLQPTGELADAATNTPDKKPGLQRYLPLSGILTDEQAAAVRALDLRAISLEQRPVREYPAGSEVASLLGIVGFDNYGLMGAEDLMDKDLRSREGLVRYVRDSSGNPLWIEPGFVRPAQHGQDVRLSIDLEIQRMCREELWRGIEECDAAGGRLVAIDPRTGEILALVDLMREIKGYSEYPWEDPKHPGSSTGLLERGDRYHALKGDPKRQDMAAAGRNRCVEDVYEPGSTFKPFVWSTITELGLAKLDEVFDTEGGRWRTSYGRPIEDVTRRQTMTWREVLINSSNIGMVKAGERLTFKQLHDAVKRFGFGQPTGVGLPGEASGLVTSMKGWSKYSQTSVSYGHEVAVTPLQMVRAFSAFCRNGEMAGTIPQVRLRASEHDGSGQTVVYRVLPSKIALVTRETMKGVAENMETKLADRTHEERAWRYSMFGKSGTAKIPLGKAPVGKRQPLASHGYFIDQYNSSFIAGGPLAEPRVVVVAVIDDPGPELVHSKRHYGAMTAGPVVRRTMERILTYLAVPPDQELPPEEPKTAGAEPGAKPGAKPAKSAAKPGGPTERATVRGDAED